MRGSIVWLSERDSPDTFPPVDNALREPDGLLAAGGDLSPTRLIAAYRRLDSAALEELFLKRAVGLSAEDIAAKKQLGYDPRAEDAVAKLRSKDYDAAFFLRPTPVEQVREVAAAGETMPPKSTYFFPKVPTGIVFNPLS